MAQKLVSKSFRTPKGCHVRSVELDSVKRTAMVSYDCGDNGRGQFPLPEGQGFSNYPKALVKGVSSVDAAGSHITGQHVGVGFVLSPRYMKCDKSSSSSSLSCHLFNENGLLAGARRRRRL